MRQLITATLAVLFSCSCIAGDFRSAEFGMSVDEVKRTEPDAEWDKWSDEEFLAFEGRVSNLDALIAYVFTDGGFSRGAYSFLEQHSNKTEYITDYEKLTELLEQKYGEPEKEQVVWFNDLYADDPEDWGMAIAVGHLAYYKRWETDSAKIQIKLDGDNFKIKMVLLYDSKKHASQLEDKREKSRMDGL